MGRSFTSAIGVGALTILLAASGSAADGAPQPSDSTADTLVSGSVSGGDSPDAGAAAASDAPSPGRESYSHPPREEPDPPEAREPRGPAEPAAGNAAPQAEEDEEEEEEEEEDEIDKAIRVFRIETAQLGVRAGSRRANANSRWHGRIYEYFRNDVLDAVPHEVRQKGGTKSVLRRNQFGFSVNGPVVIPKIYDGRGATFFTFSYEGTREKVSDSNLVTLPTARQRLGDFSDLVDQSGNPVAVYDPASTGPNAAFDPSQIVSASNLQFLRTPFADNRIPLSRLDPVAAKILPAYPLPNTSVGPFFQNNYWVNPPQQNTPDGLLASIDHSLLVRHKINVDLAYSKGFQGSPDIYPTIADPGRPDRRFSNKRLSLRETFLISPSAVYTGSVRATSQGSETLSSERGANLPAVIGLAGVSGSVFPTLRFGSYQGMGSYSGAYFSNFWNSYETGHSLTLQRGRHSWRLSTELAFDQLNTLELESPSGYFRFNEEQTGLPGIKNTGDPFASFLLGRSYSAEATDLLQPSYLRRAAWQGAVQDEFEVTPSLTATFRLRLDVTTPQVEKFDRQSTIDLHAINPETGTPGALVFANGNGARGRAFQPVRARLEPQLGLAWSPAANRNTVVRAAFSRSYRPIPLRPGIFGTQGFSVRRTLVSPNAQLEPAVILADGVPPSEHPLPDLRAEAANGTNADFVDPSRRQPRFDEASLNFERRFSAGFVLRLGGEVLRGRDLLVNTEVAGLNAIPLSALSYRDALNNESFRRSLRPYPQFQQLNTNYLYPAGRYHSESGFVEVEKRASHGLSMEFQYALRSSRDDYSGPGVQVYEDPATAWSLTRGLRPHRVSLNYSYELPFGRGKGLLNSGWLGTAFGNWSISGFTRWLSGDPIVFEPVFNNTGGVVPHLRVSAVDGADPHLPNPGPRMWFNAAAFVEPEDFQIGNVSRTHPSLRNPGYHNHDLSITKRLSISSERSLEFLLQGFNFIHHGNWADPDASIGPAEAPNVNAGRILESLGGRVIQLGLRYNF